MADLCTNIPTAFIFKRCVFDDATHTIFLTYGFDTELEFTETITFKDAPNLRPERKIAFEKCMRLLHLACGISYYKAFIPSKMETCPLTKDEVDFFTMFYESGLGEFSYRNGVIPSINFEADLSLKSEPEKINLAQKTIVPVGGGKDSIVTIQTLQSCNIKPTLFSVGLPRPIKETIERSGLNSIQVIRKIAPELIELNKNPNVLNGHVPITGIIAFILMTAAVLYDFKDVCMSNERSANVGNTILNGKMVNHQWSKSFEFEQAFRKITQSVLPEFRYFSILRPLSELNIARLFAKSEKYDDIFTSCNKAFKLDEHQRIDYWCGNCDKCRFVFLALGAFMEKERLLKIFKRNPLNEPEQLIGFKQLLGLADFKPFECVGEISESQWAFLQMANRPEWENDYVVKSLKNMVKLPENKFFTINEQNLIPKEYEDVIGRFKE